MTRALENAFAKAADLPEAVQNQLAEQVLDEIAGELKWDQSLANSQEILEAMADKARKAHQRGKTVNKGFDEL